MAIATELLAAYTATDFVVFDGKDNGPSRRASRRRASMRCWTATTPPAQPSSPLSIRAAGLAAGGEQGAPRSLVQLLKERGLTFLLGEGRDPGGQWTAETECIVFGISLAEGLEIARRFEQNAVVFIERGKAPRLEFPEE